jgi:hypothetical protein
MLAVPNGMFPSEAHFAVSLPAGTLNISRTVLASSGLYQIIHNSWTRLVDEGIAK